MTATERRIPVLGHRRGDDVGVLARRVVALGILPCLPVIAISWLREGSTDPLVGVGYPLLFGYLLLFSWVLLRRPRLANAFAIVTLSSLEAWWLVMIVMRSAESPDAATAWGAMFPTPILGVVVCLVVGFLFQRTRVAFAHGLGYAVVATTVLALALRSRPDGAAYVYEAVRVGYYFAVVLGLVVVLSVAKERMVWAVDRASRASATAAAMRGMAYRDELTGAANRRRLLEELTHQAARVGPRHPVSVVFFDLDHFKHVNDTLGHVAGDRVLRVVVEVAGRVVRERDLVARFGGEEFVVVAPGIDRDDAIGLAERLRHALPDAIAAAVGTRVTASFGVATLRPGDDAIDVLRRADARMYAAKRGGRDRIEWLTPEVPASRDDDTMDVARAVGVTGTDEDDADDAGPAAGAGPQDEATDDTDAPDDARAAGDSWRVR